MLDFSDLLFIFSTYLNLSFIKILLVLTIKSVVIFTVSLQLS